MSGILLVDKNADYSAIAVGHAGLYTTVTSGLLSLFETRGSVGKTEQNSAPANAAPAVISGAPVFSTDGVTLTTAGQISFPSRPSNGGENTFAAILELKGGGQVGDAIVGSVPGTPNDNGSIFLSTNSSGISVYARTYDSQSAATGLATISSVQSLPGEFGKRFLVVVTAKSEDSLTLYVPRAGATKATALAAGRFLFFNGASGSSGLFRAPATTVTQSQNLSMFAHWNRALSAGEVSTFYGEMRQQYERLDIAV